MRYDAGAQASLPTHTDQSLLSFTIALNDPSDYEGGGASVCPPNAARSTQRLLSQEPSHAPSACGASGELGHCQIQAHTDRCIYVWVKAHTFVELIVLSTRQLLATPSFSPGRSSMGGTPLPREHAVLSREPNTPFVWHMLPRAVEFHQRLTTDMPAASLFTDIIVLFMGYATNRMSGREPGYVLDQFRALTSTGTTVGGDAVAGNSRIGESRIAKEEL